MSDILDGAALQNRYDAVVLTVAQLTERYGGEHLPQGTTDGLTAFELLTVLALTLGEMHNQITHLELALQSALLDRQESLDAMYKLATKTAEMLKVSKATP